MNMELNQSTEMTTKAMRWSVSKKYARRDVDPVRLKAFIAAEAETRKKYFTSRCPELWYMQLLVTHRDFRRHGAASALVQWGAAQADAEHVWCGTESSPMGKPVYESVGFHEIGRMVIQANLEDAKLDFPVMLRESKGAGDVKHPMRQT